MADKKSKKDDSQGRSKRKYVKPALVAMGVLGQLTERAWGPPSSARLKRDIRPLKGALRKVLKLQGVSYRWKATGRLDVGLVAEEVAKVFPELVAVDSGGRAMALEYAKLNAVLIEAVREQEATLRTQRELLESHSREIKYLKKLSRRA